MSANSSGDKSSSEEERRRSRSDGWGSFSFVRPTGEGDRRFRICKGGGVFEGEESVVSPFEVLEPDEELSATIFKASGD